jgi:hypothetical protein
MAAHFHSLAESIDCVANQLDPSFAEDLKRALDMMSQQMDIAIDTFEASLLINGHRHEVQLLCSVDLNVVVKNGSVIRLTAMTKLKGSDNG